MKTAVRAEHLEDLAIPATPALKTRVTSIVSFDWFGDGIAVGFDSDAAARIFRRSYESFANGGPTKLRATIVNDGDGLVIVTEPGAAYRWPHGPLEAYEIAFLADVMVRRAYFSHVAAYVSFHAAAINVGGAAAAISASSQGGKTTTAIACARRGMPLYSDERCVLSQGHVLPFERGLNLRAASLALLAREEVAGDRGIGERLRARPPGDWRSVTFAEIFGAGAPPAPAPLRTIFFIDGCGSSAAVKPLGKEIALRRLMSAPLRSRVRGIDALVGGYSVLQGVSCYALELGSPDETARLIQTIVQATSEGRQCA